jgi:hypothetical protein
VIPAPLSFTRANRTTWISPLSLSIHHVEKLVAASAASAAIDLQKKADATPLFRLPPSLFQAAAVLPASAAFAADDAGVASSRMSYSRFLVRSSHLLPTSFPLFFLAKKLRRGKMPIRSEAACDLSSCLVMCARAIDQQPHDSFRSCQHRPHPRAFRSETLGTSLSFRTSLIRSPTPSFTLSFRRSTSTWTV